MDYETFIGAVQNRAQLPTRSDALTVTRVTLEHLSQRIPAEGASNLGAQLPAEIGRHLEKVEGVETFTWEEFVERIVEDGGYAPDSQEGQAVHHARAVMDVVEDAVAAGALEDVRGALPTDEDWDELFVVERDVQPIPEEQRPE